LLITSTFRVVENITNTNSIIMTYNCYLFFLIAVSDTLEVAARVHGEWDARLSYEHITRFELNHRFPPLLTSNENGLNPDQVTVPVGQKSIVWRTTPDVIQLSANTYFQHKRPIQSWSAAESTDHQTEWVTYQHARLPAKENQQQWVPIFIFLGHKLK